MSAKYPTAVLGEDGLVYGDPGMDLIDHFAIEILKAFIEAKMVGSSDKTVAIAYDWADAMMQERKRYNKPKS